MKRETSLGKMAVLVILIFGMMVWGSIPARGADNGKKQAKVQPVGIINPDGVKKIWLVNEGMAEFLSGYASRQIEGLKFYQLTSWKDTAIFLTAVNEHQGQMIQDLAANMKKLNKRVKRLERKALSVTAYPVNHRLEALEKKVKYMSGGAYP